MLNTLIIDIKEYSVSDSVDLFVKNSGYQILFSLYGYSGDSLKAFVITDSRTVADEASMRGIGFTVYLNDTNREESFKDSLYCIESIKDMSDDYFYKTYQRYVNEPWTIFETDELLVREMTVDDIDALYELYSDADVKMYTDDLYEDKEKEIEFIRNYIAYQYRFYEYGFWLVFDKTTGELIGRCGLSDREGFDTTELGFVFAKKCWGKGIAYNVCMKILEYAKDNLEMEKLLSFTKEENVRAKKLLERLEFVYVGEVVIGTEKYLKFER